MKAILLKIEGSNNILLSIDSIESIQVVSDDCSMIRTKSGNVIVVEHIVADILEGISEAEEKNHCVIEIKPL
jgi:hypothetical protein